MESIKVPLVKRPMPEIPGSDAGISEGDVIPSTRYTFVEELPIAWLDEYKDHRRLMVFFHKGMECANPHCSTVGSRLIIGKDRGGNLHVDVYTDELELMTVDHLVPVSKGGSNRLDNKVPLCRKCNAWKSNKFVGLEGFSTPEMFQKRKKKKVRGSRYGVRWRRVIRKTPSFHFYGIGDNMLWWMLPKKEKLQYKADSRGK